MASNKIKWYNLIALVCGLWFLITGSVWIYYINVVISFPVALIGFYFWLKGRKLQRDHVVNKITLWIYILAGIISIGSLLVLLMYN